MLKSSPRFIFKRQFKNVNVQAFLHDVYNSDLQLFSIMPDVVDALGICDKHAPLRRFWVSGRNEELFSKTR